MNSGQHITEGELFHSWYHCHCLFHHANGIKTSDTLRVSSFDMSGEKCLEPGAVISLLILKVHEPNHSAYCPFYFDFKGPATFKILSFCLPLGEREQANKIIHHVSFLHPRHVSEYFHLICHLS